MLIKDRKGGGIRMEITKYITEQALILIPVLYILGEIIKATKIDEISV